MRLAHALAPPDDDVRAAYYVALLHHVGCVGFAYETAQLFGDELRVNTAAGRADHASQRSMVTTLVPIATEGRSLVERARFLFALATQGDRWGKQYTTAACEVGCAAARRLGLPAAVEQALLHVYDLWGDQHDAIPIAARIARTAGLAALFDAIGGTDFAVAAIEQRSGGMLDPTTVDAFLAHGSTWLAEFRDADVTETALAAEPDAIVTGPDVRVVAEVFGDLADLKSPCFIGHSRAVSALAVGAANWLGLGRALVADLDTAALLHDIGCVAVSNRLWDKPARFTAEEWEQVRLHPYYAERIVAGSGELARLAPLVGRHHERLDGSGYHRGCTAADLSMSARILVAAVTFRTRIEERPHRGALTPEAAGQTLRDEARTGALDPDAVSVVLAAAGNTAVKRRSGAPAGLTEREVEVLGLLARGCSNASIAAALTISRRTAEHHVQHVYTKIGVSSRAGATLFAVRHGLVD